MDTARAQQAIIVPHEQMALNLLERIENHTDEDEQRCATEELSELGLHIKQSSEGRHTCNRSQEQRTRQCDAVHYLVNELCCWAAVKAVRLVVTTRSPRGASWRRAARRGIAGRRAAESF